MIQTGHDEFENYDAVLRVKLQCKKNYITFGNDNDAVREYVLGSGGGKLTALNPETSNLTGEGKRCMIHRGSQRITKKPAP